MRVLLLFSFKYHKCESRRLPQPQEMLRDAQVAHVVAGWRTADVAVLTLKTVRILRPQICCHLRSPDATTAILDGVDG